MRRSTLLAVLAVAGALGLAVPALLPAGSVRAAAGEPLTVAAAASLRLALVELRTAYNREGGPELILVFGASGSLAHQIENGAPYDVFVSAEARWVRALGERGLIDPATLAVYGEGVLALAVREGVSLAGVPALLDGSALERLLDPAYRVIAVANPRLAPYGMAGREALERAGLWQALQPRIVYGENVGQLLSYLETGNADAALLAASLLTGATISWRPVSPALHNPIRHALGIVAATPHPAEARRFVAFLTGAAGRALLRRHGLHPPSPAAGGGPARGTP